MLWQGNYVVVAFANVADAILNVVSNVAAPSADFSVVNDAEAVSFVDDVTHGVDVARVAPSN